MNKRRLLARLTNIPALKRARLKRLYKHQPTLRVVTFHRVIDDRIREKGYLAHEDFPKLSQFLVFAKHIAEHYNCVHLPDYVEHGGAILSRDKPNIALTFDDGYKDNVTTAFPALNKYNIPVTVFCTMDSLDGKPLWFQELFTKIHQLSRQQRSLRLDWIEQEISLDNCWKAIEFVAGTCKNLNIDELQQRIASIEVPASNEDSPQLEEMMTWDDLAGLKDSPLVTVGAHTCSHWNLTRLNDDDLKHELDVPLARIREFMDMDKVMIAYPNGRYDERVLQAVEKAGYSAGFITHRGINTDATPKFRYHREYSLLAPELLDFQLYDFDRMINGLLGRR